ncbi:unnamed protein product [Angiostrongylus costaricensis]|uniref:DUF4283 domain-containing protein n=1 Tax=Angiostrongylus costaricensis TaxID=334426 RepID=A0A158PFB7_ANGCS|nr:unnamed protein product [Angiostrongylus costaricensis]
MFVLFMKSTGKMRGNRFGEKCYRKRFGDRKLPSIDVMKSWKRPKIFFTSIQRKKSFQGNNALVKWKMNRVWKQNFPGRLYFFTPNRGFPFEDVDAPEVVELDEVPCFCLTLFKDDRVGVWKRPCLLHNM